MQAQIRKHRAELYRLRSEPQRDERSVLLARAKINDLQHWMEQRELRFRLEVLALLTREKREEHAARHDRAQEPDEGTVDAGGPGACPWWEGSSGTAAR